MIIHSIHADGFKIFGDRLNLQFPEKGKIGILGPNESGKSTFLQLIEYALYGLKKGSSGSDLITWGRGHAKLSLEFSSGQERYLVERTFSKKGDGTQIGHRAKLIPIKDGKKDVANSISTIQDIIIKIEQITGMDRDSFLKLIYIGQKDLDALKGVPKSQREGLINKVMGIDVFDSADFYIKADIKQLKNELALKKRELQTIFENKKRFEQKRQDLQNLDASVERQKNAKKKLQTQVSEQKTELEKFQWLKEYQSVNELILSLNEQKKIAERDKQAVAALAQDVNAFQSALAEYGPVIRELQHWQNVITELDGRLIEAEANYESIKKQQGSALSEQPGAKAWQTEATIKRVKQQQLTRFVVLLMVSFLSLVGAFFIPTLGFVAVILFLGAAYFFYKFYSADVSLSEARAETREYDALERDLRSKEQALDQLKQKKAEFLSQARFESLNELNMQLEEAKNSIKSETGADSLEAIQALLDSKKTDCSKLTAAKPEEREKALSEQINNNRKTLESLEHQKPAEIGGLVYSEKKHRKLLQCVERLEGEFKTISEDIKGKEGARNQISADMEHYKPDFDRYPDMEKDVELQQQAITTRERVQKELLETSKTLRDQVMPRARMIMGTILSTITDQRYSNFKIEDDLTFSAYSDEAGGYKKREIFSGGTQDQFLIALRLAFTQSILDSRMMADRYAILMDECISSSDKTRKQGIFEVLDLKKDVFSQIFMIAHEDIHEFVDQYLVLERNEDGLARIKAKSW